jgi:2-iminobutanoate/2-iminopropanoate deaminase
LNKSEDYEREIVSRPIKASLPFSPAVACGPFVFLSGLVGRDFSTGQIAVGDITRQMQQAMRNLAGHLERAGTSLENALKVTIFLTDMGSYGRMNEAYIAFFKGDPPARTCVQVARLPDPDALVEIELVALRPMAGSVER